LDTLPVKAAMGVGGAFDYISGEVIRAPYIIRAMGLNGYMFGWSTVAVKRQLALVHFVLLVVKEVFSRGKK